MIGSKTDKGLAVLKDRSVHLTPRQRSAFVLCDGKRSVGEVLELTKALGTTLEDVNILFHEGLLVDISSLTKTKVDLSESGPPPSTPRRSRQQRYQDAYPVAIRLSASLGLRGFRLNLAVEAAGGYEQLKELAPKIRDAVGEAAFEPLEKALLG